MSSSTSRPAYSFYGESAMRGQRPAGSTGSGSRIAAGSAPYVGRGTKCAGNEDTCNANKVRGQDYCAGHLKGVKSAPEKEDDIKVVVDGE